MKAVFLDRDGIINKERGDYTYTIPDFIILPHVIDTLHQLKSRDFKLIVITNQAGIAKGIYSREQMQACHRYFQQQSNNAIDDFYYAPDHPTVSESLSRKPDSLLFERALAKHSIDPNMSYMVGDKERDLIPAKKLGIATVLMGDEYSDYADFHITRADQLLDICRNHL